MKVLDGIRGGVKGLMRSFARLLNKASGGHITPNQITLTGLIMHVPIAWLIAQGNTLLAAGLLLIFGLFDTLDGELARLQKSSSAYGMFLDSSTDRIKEILVYCGITALLFNSGHKYLMIITVGALGVSLCTSYLNAWGEAVMAAYRQADTHKVNKTFRNGLLGFDVRTFLIIVGLLFNRLDVVMYIIFGLATITVLQRFIGITNRLKNVQN